MRAAYIMVLILFGSLLYFIYNLGYYHGIVDSDDTIGKVLYKCVETLGAKLVHHS